MNEEFFERDNNQSRTSYKIDNEKREG